MKTYKIDYEIRKGLVNELGESSKVQGLQSCGLLKSSEGGLVSDDAISFAIDWSNHVIATCNFPFPQFIQLGEVNLICTDTEIWEYKNAKRGMDFYLGITVSAGGRAWKVADFGTYFVLTNGFVTVVHDPDLHTYTELIEDKNIPQAECLTNFNGQCIAGGIDNSWSFYEAESLYIPPFVYNIVSEELKEIIGELEVFEQQLQGQDTYITPSELPVEILPQGYKPPAESPTTYFTVTSYTKDLTADWHVDWETYCDSNAIVYYNGKVYILLKTITTTQIVLTFLIYTIGTNTWALGSGHFIELRKLLSTVKQQLMLNNGNIYVTCNSEIPKTLSQTIDTTNMYFMESKTSGFLHRATNDYLMLYSLSINHKPRLYTYYYFNFNIPLLPPSVSCPNSNTQILNYFTINNFSFYSTTIGAKSVDCQVWLLATNPGNITSFSGTNPFSTIVDKLRILNRNQYTVNISSPYWNNFTLPADERSIYYFNIELNNIPVYIVVGTKLTSETNYRVCYFADGNTECLTTYRTGDGYITTESLDLGEPVYATVTVGVLGESYNFETYRITLMQQVSVDNIVWGNWVPYGTPLQGERYIKFRFVYPNLPVSTIANSKLIVAERKDDAHLRITTGISASFIVREDAKYDTGLDTWTDFTLPTLVNKKVSVGDTIYTLVGDKIKKVVYTVDRSTLIDEATNLLVTDNFATDSTIAIATDTNNLYLAGGRNSSGTITTAFRSYNPASNNWNNLPNLPVAIYNATMTYSNGVFYLIGGYTAAGLNTTLYRYKFSTGRWENIGTLSSDLVNSVSNLDVVTNDGNLTLYIYNTTSSSTKVKTIVKLLIQA